MKRTGSMNSLKSCAGLLAVLAGSLLYPATGYADHLLGLSPETALNRSDGTHTVTATLTLGGSPVSGVTVYFEVTAGPNTGTAGSGVTNASGQVAFTYNGTIGKVGVDTISACADADLDTDGSFTNCANDADPHNPEAVPVSKTWIDVFAKVSGNAGSPIKVQGSRQYAFQGLVGEYDSTVVGSIAINYRSLGTVCTFTPGSGTFGIDGLEQIATLTGWAFSCTNTDSGTATIVLKDATLVPPRGSISVDASNDTYDIAPITGLALNTGKVEVDDLGTP